MHDENLQVLLESPTANWPLLHLLSFPPFFSLLSKFQDIDEDEEWVGSAPRCTSPAVLYIVLNSHSTLPS
jgi:hypothetical protein